MLAGKLGGDEAMTSVELYVYMRPVCMHTVISRGYAGWLVMRDKPPVATLRGCTACKTQPELQPETDLARPDQTCQTMMQGLLKWHQRMFGWRNAS
ncbi:hypothetical protein VFPPC_15325 [Pochonia chlamydosporia 170]|uniref:Uncharacterized protein n=1 Tax=Pochonia chlamydosporia 170 TaxID=1380566 RepID=A0A179G816_METCM|nr:hypothetical protein VFPPC_15325 [Pochonia chlamydosporia 170]OAQ73571.1 hypothetical protein VFPPC_15325 [Pochonia chlamydosporia 170]